MTIRNAAITTMGDCPQLVRWGSYTRISEDPFDKERGVRRQAADNEEAIAKRGGTLVKEYRENDTSAYKKRRITHTDGDGFSYNVYRVIRPVWQAALRDLRAGVIDALMVWDLDRLSRDPRDLEDAIEVVQYYGKRIETVTAGSLTLTSDSGIAMARVLTAMNNKSSADTARRVKRAHLEGAENGFTPGGRRPFGYSAKDRNKLDKTEAKYARKMAAMILDGHSLGAVAKMMNDAGMPTSRGNLWDQGTVRQYFNCAYRLIGVRALRGNIVYKDDKAVRGNWESLLTEADFYAIQAVLVANRANQTFAGGRPGAKKYLLTGLLRCKECLGNMTGNVSQYGKAHNYVCRGRKHGFNHTMTVTGSGKFEETVIELVAERIRIEDCDAPTEAWPDADRLRDVQARIQESIDLLKDAAISPARVVEMIRTLEAEEKALLREQRKFQARSGRAGAKKTDSETFLNADIERQREIIADYIDCIIVDRPTVKSPGRKGGFDYDRIDIQWIND